MLERLYVNNFRCFENFSIDLTDRQSALVIGKNGTGKSTFMDALGVLRHVFRGSSRIRDIIAASDFAQHRKQIPMRFEIELKLNSKRFKYAITFEVPENLREPHVAEESLSVDGVDIFSRDKARISLGGESTFDLDWNMAALPVINERPGERSIQQIKAFFASMVLIAPIPANMSGFSEDESFEINKDASNFSSWLNALLLRQPKAYNVLDTYLKSVIPDFGSFQNIERGENGKQLLLNFEHENSTRGLAIDFKHLSDGEKCFFLSALIVAANKVDGPLFCMWDEPENYLSLPEIGHFIVELRRLTNQRGQFVAISHHPETIRRFSDDNTFVFARRSHFEPTVVRTLSDLPYNGDLIEALVRDEILG
jgi:predicted ATPase